MTQFTFIPAADAPEIADEIRALFDDIASRLRHEHRAYSGECQPALDVLETDAVVEIAVDVCGVPADALRVLVRSGFLIVAGEKAPPPSGQDHAYHLVEREFGRFARAVRLNGAYDIARARATLTGGELTVVLPKIVDRRGQAHRIQVTGPGA